MIKHKTIVLLQSGYPYKQTEFSPESETKPKQQCQQEILSLTPRAKTLDTNQIEIHVHTSKDIIHLLCHTIPLKSKDPECKYNINSVNTATDIIQRLIQRSPFNSRHLNWEMQDTYIVMETSRFSVISSLCGEWK